MTLARCPWQWPSPFFLQTDAQDRKVYMKTLDLNRRKNERLNDLEEEEKVKGEALRQKAIEQLQEQEDEIKKLNEVFLTNFSKSFSHLSFLLITNAFSWINFLQIVLFCLILFKYFIFHFVLNHIKKQ